MSKLYYVYIMTNERNTVLYTGVTNDLMRRVCEHRSDVSGRSFVSRYNVHKLVYFEETGDAKDAIAREKEIKGWKRYKKKELIGECNPDWNDLAEEDNIVHRDSSVVTSE